MQDFIPITKYKPFRGIATIQLFDKETGELLEEHVDENTYNDRIPYITYLYSIMRSQCSAFKRTMPNYYSLEPNTSDLLYAADSFSIGDIESESNIRYFGNLLLTANTDAEDAHGYFNGVPVGLANATGYSLSKEMSCIGKCNCDESYFGNDRLHLVFDFETSKCNVSFDALWLLPTMGGSNDGSNRGSAIYYPQSRIRIMSTKGNDVTPYDGYYDSYDINNEYNCVYEHTSSSTSSTKKIWIFDKYTGEVLVNCTLSEDKSVYAPLYYNKNTKDLYFIYWPRYYNGGGQNGLILDFKYFLNKSFDKDYQDTYFIRKINLESGTITNVKKFSEVFNVSNNDYGYSLPRGSLQICYTLNGNITFAMSMNDYNGYTDGNAGYVFFYSFDPATLSVSLLSKYQAYATTIYINTDTGGPYNYSDSISMRTTYSCLSMGLGVLSNNKLYTNIILDMNAAAENRYAVFDINTGKVINRQFIGNLNLTSTSPSSSSYGVKNFVADGINKRVLPVTSDYYTSTNSDVSATSIHDFMENKRPQYVFVNERPNCYLRKYDYYTQLWSTHNKLTSEVKKTNMTTMKITYDIIWESYSEEIVPNLA